MSYFKAVHGKTGNQAFWLEGRIQDEINIKKRKMLLMEEAKAKLGSEAAAVDYEAMLTDDIESEEVDIFERKAKFDELVKRFESRKLEKAYLKGNDLRYNIYLKKIGKLSRTDLGLDLEAYKDY